MVLARGGLPSLEPMAPKKGRKAAKADLEEPSPSLAADVDSVTSERPSRKVTEFFLTRTTPKNEATPSLACQSDKASLDAGEDDAEEDHDTRPLASLPQVASSSAQLPAAVSEKPHAAPPACAAKSNAKPEVDAIEQLPLSEANLAEFESLMEKAHLVTNASEVVGNKLVDDFTRAAQDGDMPSRGAVAQRFRRSLAATESAAKEYADARKEGREAAKAFRIKWAAQEVERLRATTTYTQAWKRVDTTLGTYKTFGKIVLDEGGWTDPSAIRGARELCKKALQLGGQWLFKNPQTGRTVCLHLELKWAETMERAWALYQEAVVKDEPPSRDAEVPIVDGRDRVLEAGVDEKRGDGCGLPSVAKTKAIAKAAGGKQAARATASEAPPKKARLAASDGEVEDDAGKKAYAARLGAATKLKTWFLQVSSRALHLKERVEKEEPWAWARGELTMGRLDQEMNDIKLALSEFDNVWIMSSSAELKNKFSKDRITVGVAEFMRLEPQVKQLELCVDRIIAMHKVYTAQ